MIPFTSNSTRDVDLSPIEGVSSVVRSTYEYRGPPLKDPSRLLAWKYPSYELLPVRNPCLCLINLTLSANSEDESRETTVT